MGTHASFRVNLRGNAGELMNSLRFVSKTAVRLNIRKALQVLGEHLWCCCLVFQRSRKAAQAVLWER